jgi:hypothetical protein
MGYFRFHRRIKIAPGVHWNIGKKGSSLSFGGRGLNYTIGPQGSRTTVGIPGTGLSYTHVHSKPPSPTTAPPAPPPPPPPAPASASPQNPQIRRPSKVFYTFGCILLVILLINKVLQNSPTPPTTDTAITPTSPTSNTATIKQNPPTSPASDTAIIKEWVNNAAKRGEEWGKQSGLTANPTRSAPLETYSANPHQSPMTVRRALPVPPSGSPPTTQLLRSYHVVNVAANDSLNLRGGPGETYPTVVRIRAGTGGIRLGANRVRNGSTFWRKISVGPHTGWVNEIYIEAE